MKNKIFTMLLIGCLCVATVGCGKKADNTSAETEAASVAEDATANSEESTVDSELEKQIDEANTFVADDNDIVTDDGYVIPVGDDISDLVGTTTEDGKWECTWAGDSESSTIWTDGEHEVEVWDTPRTVINVKEYTACDSVDGCELHVSLSQFFLTVGESRVIGFSGMSFLSEEEQQKYMSDENAEFNPDMEVINDFCRELIASFGE